MHDLARAKARLRCGVSLLSVLRHALNGPVVDTDQQC